MSKVSRVLGINIRLLLYASYGQHINVLKHVVSV